MMLIYREVIDDDSLVDLLFSPREMIMETKQLYNVFKSCKLALAKARRCAGGRGRRSSRPKSGLASQLPAETNRNSYY